MNCTCDINKSQLPNYCCNKEMPYSAVSEYSSFVPSGSFYSRKTYVCSLVREQSTFKMVAERKELSGRTRRYGTNGLWVNGTNDKWNLCPPPLPLRYSVVTSSLHVPLPRILINTATRRVIPWQQLFLTWGEVRANTGNPVTMKATNL